MNMRRMILAAALLAAANSTYAAEKKDIKGYYETLLKGLRSKIQSKFESRNRVSAVAAVRGAKQGSDAEALYWKGGVSEQARKKLSEEKETLAAAVQLVVDGRTEEGRAALQNFLKDAPESLYAADAREALSNLPSEEVKTPEAVKPAEVPAEPKDERPAEAKPAGAGPSSGAPQGK